MARSETPWEFVDRVAEIVDPKLLSQVAYNAVRERSTDLFGRDLELAPYKDLPLDEKKGWAQVGMSVFRNGLSDVYDRTEPERVLPKERTNPTVEDTSSTSGEAREVRSEAEASPVAQLEASLTLDDVAPSRDWYEKELRAGASRIKFLEDQIRRQQTSLELSEQRVRQLNFDRRIAQEEEEKAKEAYKVANRERDGLAHEVMALREELGKKRYAQLDAQDLQFTIEIPQGLASEILHQRILQIVGEELARMEPPLSGGLDSDHEPQDEHDQIMLDRGKTYGKKHANHANAGFIFQGILSHALGIPLPPIPAHVVALMMVSLKCLRAAYPGGARHADNYLDGRNYLTIAEHCAQVEAGLKEDS